MLTTGIKKPIDYRLCPHVVVVVGLLCFDDPWGYVVEPLMPDRPMVRF